jgi:hypothetical protein
LQLSARRNGGFGSIPAADLRDQRRRDLLQ